jgi:hypothetical protein
MKNILSKCLLLTLGLGLLSCNTTEGGQEDKPVSKYGLAIPFMLGIHNEHIPKDSVTIEFIDNSGDIHLIHQGSYSHWGMRWTDQTLKTGEYLLVLTWKEDSVSRQTKRRVIIKPETNFFSLNIELANESFMGREHNAIYLDQYTAPLDNVQFTRNWNPSEQFMKDSILLPNYTVLNKNDSVISGAYMRHSSSLSINWVQPHYIAFMWFETLVDSTWRTMSCSAPRIQMDLKHEETGKTLDDMVLGCPVENFETGKDYRIRIDYMLNNRIFEQNAKVGDIEDNVYVEQTIYTYTDEFRLDS